MAYSFGEILDGMVIVTLGQICACAIANGGIEMWADLDGLAVILGGAIEVTLIEVRVAALIKSECQIVRRVSIMMVCQIRTSWDDCLKRSLLALCAVTSLIDSQHLGGHQHHRQNRTH